MFLHEIFSAYPITKNWGDNEVFSFIEDKKGNEVAYSIFYCDAPIPKDIELEVENLVADLELELYEEFKQGTFV